MAIKHFTSSELTGEALRDKGVVLVDFWASWCGPCRMIGPVVERLSEDYAGRATVGKLNIDEEMAAAEGYRVTSIPTLILFRDGVEKERVVGARGQEALEELLDKYC